MSVLFVEGPCGVGVNGHNRETYYIYVPVPGPRTPPPPPNGMVPPLPRISIIRIFGMMLAMLGMLSVRALQLRSQTPFHPVNQHPRTSRNILPYPSLTPTLSLNQPKPQTHPKPTANQP